MVMRIGGLASGMDIDGIVKKLMQAEKAPLNKLLQNKQRYEWQRDAYRDVNKKLKTFDTYLADNFTLKGFSTKTANSSNSNLVSAIASGQAAGTVTIDGVTQLAEASRITGGQINATGSTKMSTLVGSDTKFIEFKAPKADGTMSTEATKIEISENMTVNDFVKKVNASGAGVTTLFENGRFSLTAQNTGSGNIEFKGVDSTGTETNISGLKLKETEGAIVREGKNAIFTVNGIATERSTNSFVINGYNITLKSKFNEAETLNDYLETAIQNVTNTKANLDNLINQIAIEYNVSLNGLNDADKLEAVQQQLQSEISNRQTIYDDAKTQLDDARTVAVSGDKTAGEVFDSLSTKVKTAISNGASFEDLKDDSELSQKDKDLLETLNDADFVALQTIDARLKTLGTAKTELDRAKSFASNLVSADINYTKAIRDRDEAQANIGNTTTTTKSAPITLTSTSNVDEMMNKIKEFVNTYNGLVKDLTDQTKQTKYRDFAPLTAEQKEEMSESEIKLWEEKARSGLLRNDPLVRDGLADMRSLVYETNPGLKDAKFQSLFSIGITTTRNYGDGGTLQIDEDKLRKALEEDSDSVERLFRGGSKNEIVDGKAVDTRGYMLKLRDSLQSFEKSIEKKAGRATMTDQQYTLGKNILDVDKRISTWQDKLKMIEARYWKQFGAMESAINKANQQSAMFFSGQQQ